MNIEEARFIEFKYPEIFALLDEKRIDLCDLSVEYGDLASNINKCAFVIKQDINSEIGAKQRTHSLLNIREVHLFLKDGKRLTCEPFVHVNGEQENHQQEHGIPMGAKVQSNITSIKYAAIFVEKHMTDLSDNTTNITKKITILDVSPKLYKLFEREIRWSRSSIRRRVTPGSVYAINQTKTPA